ALVVVQRNAAQGQRLHEHRHGLHQPVRALEDVVDANGLQDVIGGRQGRVVPVPHRFDLRALRRGGVVLPLDARVHRTELLGAAGTIGGTGVNVPGTGRASGIEPDVVVVPRRDV